MMKLAAYEILGTDQTRVEIEEGSKCASYDISSYTYNLLARQLLKSANAIVAINLLLANGAIRHREPMLGWM